MIAKNDVLNRISNFNCTIDVEKIKFPGILQEVNGNIVLNAMVSVDQYQKMLSNADFNILGSIFGKEATLIGCHIHSTSGSMGSNDVSLLIIPNEIIVGKCFASIPMVKRITLSTPDLNYMFAGTSPLEPNRNIAKENPSVLNFTCPKPIRAQDKYGEIELYQKYISHDSDKKGYLHTIISVVAYSFASPLSLMDAVAKAFAAINLFSFFGNGYISYGEISFQVENDGSEYMLYLNYRENVPAVNEPFLIMTSAFEGSFEKIWRAWLDLYESANPIPALFYEIICNRSTRINSFLNLSQAIEVYSNTCRDDKAKAVAKNDPNNTGKWKLTLKHRYQDILSAYNNVFELSESNIEDYARSFSNMRNYYTHYNSGKYVAPTHDELFAAIHILRFVLLTIVYSAAGLPNDCILECKNRNIFKNFNYDTGVILNYSQKSAK